MRLVDKTQPRAVGSLPKGLPTTRNSNTTCCIRFCACAAAQLMPKQAAGTAGLFEDLKLEALGLCCSSSCSPSQQRARA